MTDRPIIFSAPMVRALLDGRKTQTRRLVAKDLPAGARYTGIHYASDEPDSWFFNSPSGPRKVPVRYEDGDRLFVREAWACHWATDDQKPRDIDPDLWSVRYLADDFIRPAARDGSLALLEQCKKGRPSIHMPRWMSRLTLIVEAVRVEPLQAISEDDAWAEGVCEAVDGTATARFGDCSAEERRMIVRTIFGSGSQAYRWLWESLHGANSWDANPQVVALTFRVVRGNIDQVAA